MPRFLFRFQYTGTAYLGWQRQDYDPNTIQGTIERAIHDLVGHDVHLYGASRTDRGVHARDMAAQADLETRLRDEELRRAIDVRLPRDVTLTAVTEVAPDFNCRHAAIGKCYVYRLYNSKRRPALLADQVYHVPRTLDVGLMRKAAYPLVGTHDFASFATLLSEKPGGLTSQPDPDNPDKPEGNIRTMHAVCVIQRTERISVALFGDGFLRGMVRGIVGTLVNVGLGKIPPETVARILHAKDRKKAGANLPGQGLTLERVFFDEAEMAQWIEAAKAAERYATGFKAPIGGAPTEFMA